MESDEVDRVSDTDDLNFLHRVSKVNTGFDTSNCLDENVSTCDDNYNSEPYDGKETSDIKQSAPVEILEPQVGMLFDTAKEAYDFYNSYARRIGFSVRKLRTNNSKADKSKILRQWLVCSCEGAYTKVLTPKKKRRENRRFDCKASFEIKLVSGGKYALLSFESAHTHALVPLQQSHLIRSHRKIEPAQVEIIDKMHESGIQQSDIFRFMSESSGGVQNLNFTRADCNNLVQRKRISFFKSGDALCLLEYFERKKQENKHFFYRFRTDKENQIRGVFFCDAKSRRDYGLFGDAVCFDTTFRTNNYDMLCAPIVGVNNHWQTTLFGCGLLDGETGDAVGWLFSTFLEAMGGKKPTSIFTDQSQGISNAIRDVFPDAHHGLCLWHIYQNAAKHLSKVFNENKNFARHLKACIYDPETVEEFEKDWDKLLVDYGLKENEWMEKLYKLREKWAQVFSHTRFCAGMTTTQRSESINKFLKSYFSKGSIVLREFVDRYSKAMEDRREKEREGEYRTWQMEPILNYLWPVEREAAKIYTRAVFNIFQEELKKMADIFLELEEDNGTICTYKATFDEDRRKTRTLVYDPVEKSVSCSCKMFEFTGILCSHALKVFHQLRYKSLPPRYYLKRWTRAISEDVTLDPYGDLIPNDNNLSTTGHYSELSHISQKIIIKGARSKEVFTYTKSLMLKLQDMVDAYINSNEEQRVDLEKEKLDL